MSDCLFCRIVSNEIPAAIVREDDELVAFTDINPQAPLHALVIPRRHIATLNELGDTDDALVGRMPADGRLFLGVNDDDVNDNRGEFTVDVRPDTSTNRR